MAGFRAHAEGVRVEVEVHVARLHVVLDVAVAAHEVHVGARLEHPRAVDGQAVEFAVAVPVAQIKARIRVAEGSAHDPVPDARIGARLNGRARHVDAVFVAHLYSPP